MLGLPEVRFQKLDTTFLDHEAAQKWAKEKIPGLEKVNYEHLELRTAETFNRVIKAIADHFRVKVAEIGTFEDLKYNYKPRNPVMTTKPDEDGTVCRIGYNTWHFHPTMLEEFEAVLQAQRWSSKADKSVEAIVAHEMGHVLQRCGRTSLGELLGPDLSQWKARRIVEDYMEEHGSERLILELGERSVDGSAQFPDEPWRETWALAFGAYWTDPGSLSRRTRKMVEQVLSALYPDVR